MVCFFLFFLISAKTLGWRFFSDFPGFCRAVGSICTISCVGSLMTLSAMSCNRYILICHRHLYPRLFTIRNSVIMCCCFYFVGFVLVALNFFGVGNHSFDHKSLECIWDRMADHNYTIVFSVVMVLIPITVTGMAYARLYLHVRRSRLKVHSHCNIQNPRPEASNSAARPSITLEGQKTKRIEKGRDAGITMIEENNGRQENQPENAQLPQKEDFVKRMRLGASGSSSEDKLTPPLQGTTKPSVKVSSDSDLSERADEGGAGKQQTQKSSSRGGSTSAATLKLARALFIIYLVFSVCWLPFSLLIVLDADDTFSHELHVTIVAWAHLHPSINWLVYYLTHKKFYAAFRKLLGVDRCCTST